MARHKLHLKERNEDGEWEAMVHEWWDSEGWGSSKKTFDKKEIFLQHIMNLDPSVIKFLKNQKIAHEFDIEVIHDDDVITYYPVVIVYTEEDKFKLLVFCGYET